MWGTLSVDTSYFMNSMSMLHSQWLHLLQWVLIWKYKAEKMKMENREQVWVHKGSDTKMILTY